MRKMRFISVPVFGGPEVLKMIDAEDVEPGPAEVSIEVQATGVGFADVMQRRGQYPGATEDFVPGLDAAGVVVAAGPQVPVEYLGKRVYARLGGGGYTDRVNAPVSSVVALPDGVEATTAVALGTNAAVARLAWERVGVRVGERELVRGAGGGIGIPAVQTAAALGLEVVAVTSSTERARRLRALGASQVIDRTADAGYDGLTFDAILDPVGGEAVADLLSTLAPNGRYLLCGAVDGLPAAEFGMRVLMNFQRSLTFGTFSLDSVPLDVVRATLDDIFASAAAGRIVPVIEDVLPLQDAAAAHERLEAGDVFGKLVLIP
jgi:NADPH:quinone reductase